jgi:hypothetical protein
LLSAMSSFKDPTIAASADAGGLLQFGASVSLNDDLRRSLLSETEEIQQASVQLQQTLHVEQERYAQNRNDWKQAAQEAQDLKDKRQEVYDTWKTNEAIQEDLLHTIHKEFGLQSLESWICNHSGSNLGPATIEECNDFIESLRQTQKQQKGVLQDLDKQVVAMTVEILQTIDDQKAVQMTLARKQEQSMEDNLAQRLEQEKYRFLQEGTTLHEEITRKKALLSRKYQHQVQLENMERIMNEEVSCVLRLF